MKKPTLSLTLATALLAAPAVQADTILISGTGSGPAEIANFLATEFGGTRHYITGDFSNFAAHAATIANVDYVIIGRTLSSAAYDNGDADGYNTLTIPVISFTSYVSRESGNRLGWHTLSASHGPSVAGDETTVTAAGSSFLDTPIGTADFFAGNPGDSFNGVASAGANVGGGTILSTINNQLQSVLWNTGDAPGNPSAAGVANFPGPRFLFNLDNDGGPLNTFNNLTPTGREALKSGLLALGIPEPSSTLLKIFGLAVVILYRRRR